MKRLFGLLTALLLTMTLGACGDDDPKAVECDPPCDGAACEHCVEGECLTYCEPDQVCDGAGNCVEPSEVCDPPCDGDACEHCVDGECVSYCDAGEVCDGEGNCVDITELCDPPCDGDACEHCVDGECVSYCDAGEVCDGEGNCVDITELCDPPCDEDACEHCVEGECVTFCEFDEECDGEGNCVELGEATIGGRCVDDDHCSDEGAFCLNELLSGLPGGLCTRDCYETECPDGSECISVGWYYLCMPLCTPGEADCRDGYDCNEIAENQGVCWGNCNQDSQCTWTGYCNYDSDEDWGYCDCPEGTHVDTDALECAYNDCDYLACENMNMTCDPTGGCEGNCALCDGCLDNDYVQSDNHCYPADAYWGGPCEKDADCPGTGMPGEDTFCLEFTGGFCLQEDGPDFVAEGDPCAGDPSSVGFIEEYNGELYEICVQSCEDDNHCRPGYLCDDAPTMTADITICLPITDCENVGCNDAGGIMYCGDSGRCWFDACLADPCAGVPDSDETCINVGDDYQCGCDEGYFWDDETKSCALFVCDAIEVTENSVTHGNNCDGTELYNAAGGGVSCTGWHTLGPEVVYSLVVSANTMVDVELDDGGNYDSSLWVTTDCADFDGLHCVVGADDPEELTIINGADEAVTYYIIADAYSGCGDFTLTVHEFEAGPVCGNGIREIGEECDNGDSEGDGCSLDCRVEFGWVCEGDIGETSVCTELDYTDLGSFDPEETIPAQTGGPLAAGESDFYMIEFSQDVLFSGTLTSDNDVDFYLYDENMDTVLSLTTWGDEAWDDEFLPAGRYLMQSRAWNEINNYTLTVWTDTP